MSEEAVTEAAEEKPVPRAAEPVKEMPKVRPGTVKAKIKAIQKATARIGSGVEKQMRENQGYVRSFQPPVKKQMEENKAAVAAIQSGVRGLVKVNQAYVQSFQPRVKAQINENREAVAAMQPLIKAQTNENKVYVKEFYG